MRITAGGKDLKTGIDHKEKGNATADGDTAGDNPRGEVGDVSRNATEGTVNTRFRIVGITENLTNFRSRSRGRGRGGLTNTFAGGGRAGV